MFLYSMNYNQHESIHEIIKQETETSKFVVSPTERSPIGVGTC